MISIVIQYFTVSGIGGSSFVNNERDLVTLMGSYKTQLNTESDTRRYNCNYTHHINARVSAFKHELVNVSAAAGASGKVPSAHLRSLTVICMAGVTKV